MNFTPNFFTRVFAFQNCSQLKPQTRANFEHDTILQKNSIISDALFQSNAVFQNFLPAGVPCGVVPETRHNLQTRLLVQPDGTLGPLDSGV